MQTFLQQNLNIFAFKKNIQDLNYQNNYRKFKWSYFNAKLLLTEAYWSSSATTKKLRVLLCAPMFLFVFLILIDQGQDIQKAGFSWTKAFQTWTLHHQYRECLLMWDMQDQSVSQASWATYGALPVTVRLPNGCCEKCCTNRGPQRAN